MSSYMVHNTTRPVVRGFEISHAARKHQIHMAWNFDEIINLTAEVSC